ncbi:EipB family protein [Terrihabitans sp. B22-R8]|uniref:EipB family protein n=1 Tax=Terrihabitans sp. B22-R8 TaxID=3425128 RepID=UPI00403C959B
MVVIAPSSVRRSRAASAAALVLLAAAFVPAPSRAESAIVSVDVLTPHRAVYDLSLVQARGRGGVQAISGRLVYEFVRRDCRSILTYRQVMSMASGEGNSNVLDFRSVTDETDDSKAFSFDTQSTLSDQEQPSIKGAAKRLRDKIEVTLQKPASRKTDVAAASLFPTEHLRRLLAEARAGAFIVEADVFDGGEPGDVASPSVAFIGKVREPGGEATPPDAQLAGKKFWPVSVSYFEPGSAPSEETPKFIFGVDLYENGIAGALRLDYGEFTLSGKLTELDILPAGACATRSGG